MQLVEDLQDARAALLIKVAGRLVGQDQRRLVHERPGDRHALPLATRQLGRQVAQAVAEADALERPARSLSPLGPVQPGVEHRQLDVALDRGPGEQVEALEDEPYLAVAHAGQRTARQLRYPLASQHILPLRGGVEAADDVHECGLAGAGRAHDGDVLPGADIEGYPLKGADFRVARIVPLVDLHEMDQRVHGDRVQAKG